MQPLTAQAFGHNAPAFNCLRGIPPILLKTNILRIGGGGGYPAQIRWRSVLPVRRERLRARLRTHRMRISALDSHFTSPKKIPLRRGPKSAAEAFTMDCRPVIAKTLDTLSPNIFTGRGQTGPDYC